MKLWCNFYVTALFAAVEKGNVEIVKLLLSNDKIDVNAINILIILLFYKVSNSIFELHLNLKNSILFKIIRFNAILNHAFQWHFKSCISIPF